MPPSFSRRHGVVNGSAPPGVFHARAQSFPQFSGIAPAGGLAAIYSRLGIRPVFALHADDSLGAGALAAVPLVRFAAALGAED